MKYLMKISLRQEL